MKYKQLTLTKLESGNFDWDVEGLSQNLDFHLYLMCITPLNSDKEKIKLLINLLYSNDDGYGFSTIHHSYKDYFNWYGYYEIKENDRHSFNPPKYTNRLSKKKAFEVLKNGYSEKYLSVLIALNPDYRNNSTDDLEMFLENEKMKFYYGDELYYKFSKSYRKDEMYELKKNLNITKRKNKIERIKSKM